MVNSSSFNLLIGTRLLGKSCTKRLKKWSCPECWFVSSITESLLPLGKKAKLPVLPPSQYFSLSLMHPYLLGESRVKCAEKTPMLHIASYEGWETMLKNGETKQRWSYGLWNLSQLRLTLLQPEVSDSIVWCTEWPFLNFVPDEAVEKI